jgi:hypothetical protein
LRTPSASTQSAHVSDGANVAAANTTTTTTTTTTSHSISHSTCAATSSFERRIARDAEAVLPVHEQIAAGSLLRRLLIQAVFVVCVVTLITVIFSV